MAEKKRVKLFYAAPKLVTDLFCPTGNSSLATPTKKMQSMGHGMGNRRRELQARASPPRI
jgi:hypothetical protein